LIVAPTSNVARALCDRHRLARDHRLVHGALALGDLGIDRHLRARTDEKKIADSHLRGRHLQLLTVADDDRLRRRQIEQRANRVVGTAACPHLEPMPEKHESSQEGGGLVEDLALDPEGGGNRVDPAGPDRHRYEHHHVQRPRPQRQIGTPEEDPGRVEDDRQAEEELPQLVTDPEGGRRRRAEEALAQRRPEGDRNREHDRDEEAVAHVAHHRLHGHARMAAVAVPMCLIRALGGGVVVRGGEGLRVSERVADVPGNRAPGAVVTALLDPLRELLDARLLRVEVDRRGLRHRIRLNGDHAGSATKHALDHGLLARVLKAADMQDCPHERAQVGARRRDLSGLANRHHEPIYPSGVS
jgi:hypothetical protein